MPDAVLIFIMPPSLEELERRLRTRNTDSEDVIQRRLREARHEIDQRQHFDFIVVNDVLDDAQHALDAILYPEPRT
jgi:guanylate kinase